MPITEQQREYRKQYRLKNKDKINEYNRRRYREKAEVREYTKKWCATDYEANKEKILEKRRERWKENPEKYRAISRKHYYVRKNRKHDVIDVLLATYQPHCPNCGIMLTRKNISVDHIKPLVVGGSDELSNKRLMCLPCNQKKGWVI